MEEFAGYVADHPAKPQIIDIEGRNHFRYRDETVEYVSDCHGNDEEIKSHLTNSLL